ncbi:hypothetical protein CNYM01_08416 [Colletotrichum nymphaeae SA-01]|uniref:Uncharacterized protein n=1 Tax=Colletotrichum nymphaeae SA-01 TaxID=1460502 RepID=A0A135UTG8_9PEZI|nr:hypothetical protein CNYM01_08416 [Colletotrichum nymphaeae SA-01]
MVVSVGELRTYISSIEDWVHCWQAGQVEDPDDVVGSLPGLAEKLQAASQRLQDCQPLPAAGRKSTSSTSNVIAQAERVSTFADFQLSAKVSRIFTNNITAIFNDTAPDVSLATEQWKQKTRITSKRCTQIRRLSPEGIIVWAVSFPQYKWAAGTMPSVVFEELLGAMRFLDYRAWPDALHTILENMAQQSQLRGSADFSEFLENAWISRQRLVLRSMPASYDNPDEGQRGTKAPLEKGRHADMGAAEIKHMFSSGPRNNVYDLPQDIRQAIMASNHWRWERAQDLITTGCISTLFPKDETSDVSLTFWCGHNEGYRLNDLLGVKPVWSTPPI